MMLTEGDNRVASLAQGHDWRHDWSKAGHPPSLGAAESEKVILMFVILILTKRG